MNKPPSKEESPFEIALVLIAMAIVWSAWLVYTLIDKQ